MCGRDAGDLIRFQIERPELMVRVEAVRAGQKVDADIADAGPPLLAYFTWGGFLSTHYGVIYDETDNIAKEPAERDAAWNERFAHTEIVCPADIRPAGGHFYIAHISC